jgi:hypothetical protein
VTNLLPNAAVSRAEYPSAGRGLSGLLARVEEAGGSATWGMDHGRFRLRATFPARMAVRP